MAFATHTAPDLDAFRQWMALDVADGDPSGATLTAYTGDVAQHLAWLADHDLTADAARPDDLKRYRAYLVGRYARASVARKLAAVRRFYELAQAHGALDSNPNPSAGLRAPVEHTARPERLKYLNAAELTRLLAAPDLSEPRGLRDRALLTLMALHGLRVAEVAGLTLADYQPGAASGVLTVNGKGRKQRQVYLTPATRAVLDAWLSARALAGVPTAKFFPLSARGIRAIVDGYLERLGLKRPGVSCHALRHTYATLALAGGASLSAIGESMGHADPKTTAIYAKVLDRETSNPARAIEGMLR
jgi:site-specific recombinase XerD